MLSKLAAFLAVAAVANAQDVEYPDYLMPGGFLCAPESDTIPCRLKGGPPNVARDADPQWEQSVPATTAPIIGGNLPPLQMRAPQMTITPYDTATIPPDATCTIIETEPHFAHFDNCGPGYAHYTVIQSYVQIRAASMPVDATSTSTEVVCDGYSCHTHTHLFTVSMPGESSEATASPTVTEDSTATASTSATSTGSIIEEIEGCTYVGCYDDDGGARALTSKQVKMNPKEMTQESCVSACLKGGFAYAGVEFGTECHCGPEISSLHELVTGNNTVVHYNEMLLTCTDPTFVCSGDQSQQCGGFATINVWHCAENDEEHQCGDVVWCFMVWCHHM